MKRQWTDEELIGSTTVLSDVPPCPSEGPGYIFDVGWEAHLRIEPVVNGDHSDAVLGQRLSEELEFLLIAVLPAATMGEQQHREALVPLG